MKKYSEITESIIDDILTRNKSGEEKIEDKISNIKSLEPIDMGCSVLWANEDLEKYTEPDKPDESKLFSFNEVQGFIKDSGWRLPTKEEVADLDDVTRKSSTTTAFTLMGRGRLVFPKTGILYRTCKKFGPMDKQLYYAWTGDECNNGSSAHIFMFENSSFIHTPRNSKSPFDFVCEDKEDKICVRLVKDK